MPRDNLRSYRAKRQLGRSGEPRGSEARPRDGPMFVIQKHAASSLHYDFRLEVDGVLASWAVPKGPSTDPREKRLAIQVEDHPLAYGDFEGVIGKGLYGAGAVIVWDTGSYEQLGDDDSMAEALERGHVSVWLHGEKVRGGYTLQRTGAGAKAQVAPDQAQGRRGRRAAQSREHPAGVGSERQDG